MHPLRWNQCLSFSRSWSFTLLETSFHCNIQKKYLERNHLHLWVCGLGAQCFQCCQWPSWLWTRKTTERTADTLGSEMGCWGTDQSCHGVESVSLKSRTNFANSDVFWWTLENPEKWSRSLGKIPNCRITWNVILAFKWWVFKKIH